MSVIQLRTATIVPTFLVGSSPQGIAYDSANNRVYLANKGSNYLSVIDGKTNNFSTLTQPNFPKSRPTAIAYDLIHDRIYVD